jgi:hypothetical protein
VGDDHLDLGNRVCVCNQGADGVGCVSSSPGRSDDRVPDLDGSRRDERSADLADDEVVSDALDEERPERRRIAGVCGYTEGKLRRVVVGDLDALRLPPRKNRLGIALADWAQQNRRRGAARPEVMRFDVPTLSHVASVGPSWTREA